MLTREIRTFLQENAEKSAEELALLAGKYPELPMPFIAQQVKGRAKIKSKLPSWHENPDTVFPQSLALEQCTSESVARLHAELLGETGSVIDLTGGFGVDGRFLAELCARYLYVERDAELVEVARSNFAVFGLADNVECAHGDGVEELRSRPDRFDLIFADPARRDARSLKVSGLDACEPNLVEVWDALLGRARRVAVKVSPGLDISSVLRELPSVRDVYVVSVENECKELFLIAERGFQNEPSIHCLNMLREGKRTAFSFRPSLERELEVAYGPPGRFLYEPNASIMKSGGFRSVSKEWNIRGLNPRTRLYGADRFIEDFPGRVFEIVGEAPIGAKEAKRLFPDRKANVISRNSGMSAVELKRKLKLRDGGALFAIGAAVSGLGRRLYACRLAGGRV